jgi:farnesyl-diphosphate farnesyltransferase
MLDKVSRTFALNIKVLGKKLRRPILLAYIYMRIADTIEDDPDLSAKEKASLLKKFSQAVNSGNADEFINALPQSWKLYEKADYVLCNNAAIVVPLLSEYAEPIKKAVEEMCSGMAEFAKRKELADGWFTIECEADLDRYCYFVAGLVGNMLTEIFGHKELRELAVSFGLALQLVNIIKDVQEDSSRYVCFVPMEYCRKHGINSVQDFFSHETPQEKKDLVMGELIKKAEKHLQDAKNYIKALPRHKHRVRLFCLWPSLMAADNLRVIREGGNKITRETVKKIIRRSTIFGWRNSWVEKEFAISFNP